MKDNHEQTKYEVLGVDNNATEREIKKAYQQRAREAHPDKGGDEDKFKKISVAYQTLSDTDSRRQYDDKLAREELEKVEFEQFKANKTVDSLLNEKSGSQINRTISSQSDDKLSYLQDAVTERLNAEVTRSQDNAEQAKRSPQYQRELTKYEKEYAEWDDYYTLTGNGAYGDPGPEPVRPEEPARVVSKDEIKLGNIGKKIANEINARENAIENGQQQLETNSKPRALHSEGVETAESGGSRWAQRIGGSRTNDNQAEFRETDSFVQTTTRVRAGRGDLPNIPEQEKLSFVDRYESEGSEQSFGSDRATF